MSIVGLIGVLFVVFLCSGFIELFAVSSQVLLYFTDEVEVPYAHRTYVCHLELHQN